jgi:hypothetical protein
MSEFNPGSKISPVVGRNVVEHTEPTGYRLGRSNGELILQVHIIGLRHPKEKVRRSMGSHGKTLKQLTLMKRQIDMLLS